MAEEDFGVYICEITNTIATELTLYSRRITIRKLEILDAAAFVNSEGQVSDDPDILAAASTPLIGVAADGVSRLLLRLEVEEPDTMSFLIKQYARNLPFLGPEYVITEDGQFSNIDGTEDGSTVNVSPKQTTDGRWFEFAVYVAPSHFELTGVHPDAIRNSEKSITRSIGIHLVRMSLPEG